MKLAVVGFELNVIVLKMRVAYCGWSLTLLGTNMSPTQGMFEDDFPFPQLGGYHLVASNQRY